MTRLGRRPMLIAAFCLLTSAATAYAECAWVLWPRNLKLDFVQTLLVYDTRQQCEDSKKEFIKDWDPKDEEEKWGFLGAQRQAHPSHWVCLPDTLDPREKGTAHDPRSREAWVTWLSFTSERICLADGKCKQASGTDWRFFAAYEAKDECDKAKADGLANLIRNARGTGASAEPASGGVRLVDKNGSMTIARFHCVPSAIDPRGPKR